MDGDKHRQRIARRFWEKVEMCGPDECWPWRGKITKDGYGQFTYWDGQKVKTVLAHRFSFGQTNEIPDGKNVLHSCDNPPCCNPGHTFVGTQADNVADCAAKGRRNQNRPHNLPANVRNEIRARYTRAYGQQVELAREYGVSRKVIGYIIKTGRADERRIS